MVHVVRSLDRIEADLAALRKAAEKAGMALGCAYASQDEFEAEQLSHNVSRLRLWGWMLRSRNRSSQISSTLTLACLFIMV